MLRRSLAALVALLAGGSVAHALHRSSPGAIRVTTGAAVSHSPGRSWQRYLSVASPEDLTRTGVVGRQIYLFNLFAYDCQAAIPNAPELGSCPATPVPYLDVVTSGPGSPDNPSVEESGVRFAFDADGVYGGGSGPAAVRRQIFVRDRNTNTLLRVTNAADGDSVRPSMSERGGVVAFESTAGLFGPPGVSQVFLYNARTNQLQRLTSGFGPSSGAMLNRTGTLVVFESTADLLGDRHDTGISQIFWYDVRRQVLHQLTAGNGPSRRPWLAAKVKSKSLRAQGVRAPAILFESTATDLPGTTPIGGPQIFAGSTKLGDRPPIARITPVGAAGCPGGGASQYPTIDRSGRHLAFVSTGDLLCNGTTGQRLFVLDSSKLPSTLYQITGRGNVQGPISAAIGLWFVSFVGTDDVSGTGICSPQLHVIDYYAGRFGAVTVAGQIPLEPLPASPDAGCDDADPCTQDVCATSICTHTPIACP